MNLETKVKESYEPPAVLDIKPVSVFHGETTSPVDDEDEKLYD